MAKPKPNDSTEPTEVLFDLLEDLVERLGKIEEALDGLLEAVLQLVKLQGAGPADVAAAAVREAVRRRLG